MRYSGIKVFHYNFKVTGCHHTGAVYLHFRMFSFRNQSGFMRFLLSPLEAEIVD